MGTESAVINLANQLEIADQFFNKKSDKEQYELLAKYLNDIIQFDFTRLLNILYRVDIPEEKLKNALNDNHDNLLSGQIIAQLLLEREEEKIRLRAKYSKKSL